MRPVQLDERLAAAAAFVRQGARMADIGCDHGKLAVHLAMSGRVQHVVAVDVREGPLAKARTLVQRAGVETLVDCRLGDGLSAVSPQEADDIVMAGISGVTIIQLLEAAPAFWQQDKRFIFVPATKTYLLRKWLCEHGFLIEAEQAALAAGYPYAVLCASYIGEKQRRDMFTDTLGLLAQTDTPQAEAYRQKVYAALLKIVNGRQENVHSADENTAALQKLCGQVKNTLRNDRKTPTAE